MTSQVTLAGRGALARDAGVRHPVLTHLIPSPTDVAGSEAFASDVRAGSYAGTLTVGDDLTTVMAADTAG